jgi:hypothetical protein
MDNRIKNILSRTTSKEAVDTNTYLNIEFNGSERLLPPDELNRVLDLGAQFNKERQDCKYYRISGSINPLISNVLFNITGSKDSLESFNSQLFLSAPINRDNDYTYAESIKNNLKEIDGWYGYFDPVLTGYGVCNFYDMEPKRDRFSFLPDLTNIKNQQVKNWELTITYPYTSDTKNYVINNGIILTSKKSVIVGGKPMTAISTPIKHNLSINSTVKIIGTNKDGIYEVKRVGLDNGNLKEYYFCIDILFSSIIIDFDSRMRKIYKDIECEYYFRKFKKIKTRSGNLIEQDDYEIYKLAFSENIYADDITQFVINEDIDVTGLVDNLNRPLSELYLSIVKTNSNNIFTSVSSGIEAPDIAELRNGHSQSYLKDIPIIQLIHTAMPSQSIQDTYNALESNININDADFYGDVVEYNIATLNETILSKVTHRFNTINRETMTGAVAFGPRPEGYFYQAHNQIKIRNFSSYIEQGDKNTVGIPDYAINLGDGRYIWRDLLDIGTTDININTVNYPFTNGCHYLYQNYSFELKRQDPFDIWNLYYGKFPADPIGNTMNNNFKVKSAQNVC